MQYLGSFYELPIEFRRTIYTSNSIESVNSNLRKVTNRKGAFLTFNFVYKLLYWRVEELKKME